MSAAPLYFKVYQGRTFTQDFRITDDAGAGVDLTGKTIHGSVKSRFGGATLATFICTLKDQTQPATRGIFNVYLSDEITNEMPNGPDISLQNRTTLYPSDFYIAEGGDKIPLFEVVVGLVAEVTP